MFYKKGIDITNDKQMFNFLKNHSTYYIMNSWNRACSIANNVKLYNLNLSGDWTTALNFIRHGDDLTLHDLIQLWEIANPGYHVSFNGRSGGYLVLTNKYSSGYVLPDEIECSDTYEDYKEYCREYYGSVKANHDELRFYTKLVQSFDKLCDELRDFCDELSRLNFSSVHMEKAIENFNLTYEDDLAYLGFPELECNKDGVVDVTNIFKLDCLFQAFCRIAECSDYGYELDLTHDTGRSYLEYKKCRKL